MAKYYALIGPKLDSPALNSAMTACSIEPSIRQVPRLYVNRMVNSVQNSRANHNHVSVPTKHSRQTKAFAVDRKWFSLKHSLLSDSYKFQLFQMN